MAEPMLKNLDKKSESVEKEGPKVLSEVESLKFEIVSLNNQILILKRDLLDTQESLLISQRAVLEANEQNQMGARTTFLKSIGMDKKGKTTFTRTPEGLYAVTFESGVET